MSAKVKPRVETSKRDEFLSVFGFKQSSCTFCHKTIDELNGMLMQCGKCKQVYFCSAGVSSQATHCQSAVSALLSRLLIALFSSPVF